jgi:hypothetical protein
MRSYHNDPTRKDGAVEQLLQGIQGHLEQWVREFVRLAKTHNTNSSIAITLSAQPDGSMAYGEISREGTLSAEEEAWLKAHLASEVSTPEQATELAGQLVAQGVSNVRPGLIALKAELAAAGASFGFSEGDTGVTYWLKLPAPAGSSATSAPQPGVVPPAAPLIASPATVSAGRAAVVAAPS